MYYYDIEWKSVYMDETLQICGRNKHLLMMDMSGNIWAMGNNEKGNIIPGGRELYHNPEKVHILPEPIIKMATYESHSIYI